MTEDLLFLASFWVGQRFQAAFGLGFGWLFGAHPAFNRLLACAGNLQLARGAVFGNPAARPRCRPTPNGYGGDPSAVIAVGHVLARAGCLFA